MMSFKSGLKHVQTQVDDIEEEDARLPTKHLTQKYDMKLLKKFTDFELWVQASLEELAGGETEVETQQYISLSAKERAKKLKKLLAPLMTGKDCDDFIEVYNEKISALPPDFFE